MHFIFKKQDCDRPTLRPPPLMKSKHVPFFHCRNKCFKKRQNARESVIVSKLSPEFQIVSNTVRMHHIPSLFSFYSLQFQIISNTVRMHHLPSLFSFCVFSAVRNWFKCRQNAPFNALVFKMISEVYNRFRYRQDAPFIVLVFKIVSAVLNAVRMHHLLSLFFQNVQ